MAASATPSVAIRRGHDSGRRLRAIVNAVLALSAAPVPRPSVASSALAAAGAPTVAAVALAAVHIVAGRLRFLDVVPRSRVLSLAGGASVAYVFVHALPELARAGATLERRVGAVAFVEAHA